MVRDVEKNKDDSRHASSDDSPPSWQLPREASEDAPLIDQSDPEQFHTWASKLGVSSERLREVVAQVGPRVSDVRQRLARPESVD